MKSWIAAIRGSPFLGVIILDFDCKGKKINKIGETMNQFYDRYLNIPMFIQRNIYVRPCYQKWEQYLSLWYIINKMQLLNYYLFKKCKMGAKNKT